MKNILILCHNDEMRSNKLWKMRKIPWGNEEIDSEIALETRLI